MSRRSTDSTLLIVADVNGSRIEIPGSPHHEEPMFTSSLINTMTDTDPIEALRRIGRRPGDIIPLTPLG